MKVQLPSRLVVGIATAGRRDALTNTLLELGRQTRLPDKLFICPASPADVDRSALARLPYQARVVLGQPGLPSQRNTILEHTEHADLLVFFDDDFYPATDYLEQVEALFVAHPSAVGFTGKVLADGKLTEGIGHDEALTILREDAVSQGAHVADVREVYSLYGCNMALRLAPIHRHRLRFDGNLPLYGWLEDLDFTRQVAHFGAILECAGMRGVHLATKAGRTSGVRFGYSQVANPLYLARKGTMTPRRALGQTLRNISRNIQRSLWRPEPWIDRVGRLKGNLMALGDLLRGQLHPRRIVVLDK